MSAKYDLYLAEHKHNVIKAYEWLRENLPGLFTVFEDGELDIEHQIVFGHDESKTNPDEYNPYDAYFYGGNRSYQVMEEFRYAWLKHIHRNPHHWQYWVLHNDDPEEGMVVMDMTYNYIIEMICDWWAFSWKSGNLYEIFDWYEKHKDYMLLSSVTRQNVESILGEIRDRLDESEVD